MEDIDQDGIDVGGISNDERNNGNDEGNNENVGNEANDTQNEDVDPHKHAFQRKPRKRTSTIWNDFEEVVDADGSKKVKCNYCLAKFNMPSTGATTQFHRHLKRCTQYQLASKKQIVLSVETVASDCAGSIANFKYDRAKVREHAAHMTLYHEYPFMQMEDVNFNKFMRANTPYWQKITRTTIKNDCISAYEIEKKKLKTFFKSINKVNITTDMWKSSNQKIGYMVVTGHFIDSDWNLQKRVLNFFHVPPPHSGVIVADALQKCFIEWGIEDKVSTITVDNARTVDTIHPSKSDLDIYLDESAFICPDGSANKFDIMGWWKANTLKFRILSKMARDILSIPITLVASESTFSADGRVVDPYRASLLPETVQVLLCGADWVRALHGLKKGSELDFVLDICLTYSILLRVEFYLKETCEGRAARSYEKITKRMQDRFGDEYKLFLLINPEDDKPVAVVVPRKTLLPETTAVPEWFAAGAFGLVTVFTLLLRNVPELQSNLLSTFDNLDLLKNGLLGALVTALILGVHEISHILVAKSTGVKLGVPYLVPSWQCNCERGSQASDGSHPGGLDSGRQPLPDPCSTTTKHWGSWHKL
ncbi:hypothetical protein F0562_019660 [Nyssa sinensis]|uniref:BED-type domain-containing protein n=1 Tax=Nyssa sinensis TaxID=561372 RepID=A0A5J5BPQ0_9ASTE|nr:hypothetical protein F0562_019660 [Nyssa sinensis]